MTRKKGSRQELDWPSLVEGYKDQFGRIDLDVYDAAGDVWPAVCDLARRLFGDTALATDAVLRAAAATTRNRSERGTTIDDLPRYVFVAAKRLLLAELELLNGHRRLLDYYRIATGPSPEQETDRRILIAELVSRMDPWTRRTFEWLVLGHTFNEIAEWLDADPQVVRNRYRRNLARIKVELSSDEA